jgi:hypothetical protein
MISQHAICGVIILGLVENLTLFFDHVGYNSSGENFVAAMIVGVIVSTFKRTISRILVLVVSLGYGVVKYVPFNTMAYAEMKHSFCLLLVFCCCGGVWVWTLIDRPLAMRNTRFFF